MSQIPRRTSEFQASSAKRPARSSRLLGSAIHQNRISSAAGSQNVRPSTTYSRVSATPMRTPAKTPSRSGGMKDRMTIVQMTAEKEKAPTEDRDFIYGKTNQILEELSKQDRFNELVQKGLKSMTLKNFIAILEYFLEPICGSVPKDFQTNYIDFLYNLLIQLEYPYNINKSSLKTPNAPHCLNNIIILLGWLADFSRVDDEPIQYKITEELPDADSVKMFMDQTNKAYMLFNEGKDYSDIEKKLRENYLEMHAGPGSDVVSEIERLKYEISQLSKESKPLSLLKELNEKKEESKALDEKIEAQNKNIGEFNRKIASLQSNLSFKQQGQNQVQKELMLLDRQLKTQLMTLEKRKEILVEITHLKSALMSKKNAVMELTEASSEHEIALSNLISRKFQLIDKLNNLLYKLSSDLDVAGAQNNFNPELYEITSSNDDENMAHMIQNIQKGLIDLKNKYFKIHLEMKEYMMKMDTEMHHCKTQNDILTVNFQQQQKKYQQVEDEESIAEQQLSTLIHSIQINYRQRKEKIRQNEKEIAERTKGTELLELELRELTEKRMKFGDKAVNECRKLYLERKNEVETKRRILNENMKALDTYRRNVEPLPEDLQNVLHYVIKKKNERMKKENVEP